MPILCHTCESMIYGNSSTNFKNLQLGKICNNLTNASVISLTRCWDSFCPS